MRLLAMTCGWLTGPLGNFLAGEHGRIRVPVPSFVIDHPKGLVLFDSGLHPACRSDAAERLGPAAAIFSVDYGPNEDVASRLTTCEMRCDRIRYLINSHLHFDHTGGNALIPNAQLVVQRREWDAGHDDELRQRNFYDPRDYDTGHDVLCIDGEHDLFGDGRIVCLPTHGHTPGHQSLRVRLDSGDVVLTADACYLRRTLEELHLPHVVFDRERMLESLHTLRRLQAGGARIVYGHDPEFWATVPQAPFTVA
jgi:glyoxylase-like metal-dependent hydrolase (beta-lactamase superfamily II)